MNKNDQDKYRLLVVDDNRAIHDDFRKILMPDLDLTELDSIEADLFGTEIELSGCQDFIIDSAFQGQEGLERVKEAKSAGAPYSLAFIDMRMPPGWDGIETIQAIWQEDPDQHVIICSAYSDHSWAEIATRLGNSDRLLILKKPFDSVEILQMAYAMSNKCIHARQAKNPPTQLKQVDESFNKQEKIVACVNNLHDGFSELKNAFNELKTTFNTLKHENDSLADAPKELILSHLHSIVANTNLENHMPQIFDRLELALHEAMDNFDSTNAASTAKAAVKH